MYHMHKMHYPSIYPAIFLICPHSASYMIGVSQTVLLNKLHNRSPSFSSFSLCTKNPFKSPQNSSVSRTSFPLIPAAGTAASTSTSISSAFPLVMAAAPPMTITLNSSLDFSSPSANKSFRILLSGTGFLAYRSRILGIGMLVCDSKVSFKERIEVLSGREESEISRGGLRMDLRTTVTLGSEPGIVLAFLVRGRGFLGSMYCQGVSMSRGEWSRRQCERRTAERAG